MLAAGIERLQSHLDYERDEVRIAMRDGIAENLAYPLVCKV